MDNKPIIAVGLTGVLMQSRPFDEAHRRWFKLFSALLEDPSIQRFADEENYFPRVHEVMERYLGRVSKEARTRYAREIYGMMTIAEVTQDDLIEDFADILRRYRQRDTHRIALITTAPSRSTMPILEKLGVADLFDIVYESKTESEPSKEELFEEFKRDYGKPELYVGTSERDIEACRKAQIRTITPKELEAKLNN